MRYRAALISITPMLSQRRAGRETASAASDDWHEKSERAANSLIARRTSVRFGSMPAVVHDLKVISFARAAQISGSAQIAAASEYDV